MVNHFLGVTIFARLFGSTFRICLMILCTLIPIVFFSSFLTWGSHSHFVEIMYMTRGPIGRNVVCSRSPSCSLPYSNSPPYLCFPFIGGWYTYSRSYIRCGFYFFMIVPRVFSIGVFNGANEMCSLIITWVGPLYIIPLCFSYSWFEFSYFGHTNGIHIIPWIIYG
jgi:hypothetical protein